MTKIAVPMCVRVGERSIENRGISAAMENFVLAVEAIAVGVGRGQKWDEDDNTNPLAGIILGQWWSEW